ncbi:hypothetical protein WMY93_020872 [Mugilogobius chulae]|uniref:Uncharacterized protein n=1 Tax=Mugilogobius chulae TaxID=88201 RepID=A0AAW0NJN6_9GOBI
MKTETVASTALVDDHESRSSEEQRSCLEPSAAFGLEEEGTEAPVMPEETLSDEEEEEKVGQRSLETKIDSLNVSGEENGFPGPSAAFESEEETLINSVKRSLDRIFLNLFSEEQTVCVEEEEKHRSLETEEREIAEEGSLDGEFAAASEEKHMRSIGEEQTLLDEEEKLQEEQRPTDPDIEDLNVSEEQRSCLEPSAAFESEEETLTNSVKRSLDRIFLNLFSKEQTVCVEEEEKHRSLETEERETAEEEGSLDGEFVSVSEEKHMRSTGEEQTLPEEEEENFSVSNEQESCLGPSAPFGSEEEEPEAASASESESLQVKREETTVEKPDLDGYRTPVGFASDESSSTDEQEISGEEQNEAEELEQTAEESGSLLSALIQNMTIWTKQKDEAVSLETSASESESSEVKTEETTVEKPDLNAYRTPVGFASEESSSTDEYESLEEEQNEAEELEQTERNQLQLYLHQRN